MSMSGFEKFFVNRQSKGRRNAAKVRQRLDALETETIHDALELGCGIGTVSAYLATDYGMHVTGTDFDPAQIAEARRMYHENKQLHFQVEDAAALTFEDNAFDLVIAHNVFHHIPNWEEAIREVHRVLRQGGYLMWLDIIFPGPIRGLLSSLQPEESFFALGTIISEFKAAGFKVQFHERTMLLLFTQHHYLLQRI